MPTLCMDSRKDKRHNINSLNIVGENIIVVIFLRCLVRCMQQIYGIFE